jgi:hypothetical protein
MYSWNLISFQAPDVTVSCYNGYGCASHVQPSIHANEAVSANFPAVSLVSPSLVATALIEYYHVARAMSKRITNTSGPAAAISAISPGG